jgi:DNA repair exonuclease SbcCD ATPase subunit
LQALENIKNEVNPHSVSIKETEGKIAAIDVKLADTMIEHERSELLNKHYHYVYKAYNDRNKIKSYIFREHIPFINSRLKHYMDVFGLDIQIKLTESLGIESNLWGYEFESGGERKRTDVAFMLAMFDFHEQMYGRQCNVLILDEVDGRMDEDGIDSLISVIKNDLAHRVETIMVISHRNMMFDTFPKEVRVTRKNRLSNIEIY